MWTLVDSLVLPSLPPCLPGWLEGVLVVPASKPDSQTGLTDHLTTLPFVLQVTRCTDPSKPIREAGREGGWPERPPDIQQADVGSIDLQVDLLAQPLSVFKVDVYYKMRVCGHWLTVWFYPPSLPASLVGLKGSWLFPHPNHTPRQA